MTPPDILREGLESLGLDQALCPALLKYVQEIELFNPAYGLVKVKDREELLARHILDSLAPIQILKPLAPPGSRAADAGSGAGLPGIPLAIALPEVNFTLIERMGRRAGFLRDCAAVLGLKNVEIAETGVETWETRAGTFAKGQGRFGLVVCRAFHPLEASLVKTLFRLISPGGAIAAYKGRLDTVKTEIEALKADPRPAIEIHPVKVPFLNEERCMVILRP